MPIDVSHAPDLRKVYLLVFDSFAASVSEVADQFPEINTRYARELLGALQQGNFVILTEDGEGSEAYQAIPTLDDISREEAEANIDKWLGIATPDPTSATHPGGGSRSPAAKATSSQPHDCLCGCGEVITTRALYRPGHDARHAGQVGREIAANYTTPGFDRRELLAALPTDALKAKAERIAERAVDKNRGEGKKQPEPTCVEGIVKVGKNERPARRWTGGSVEYLLPGKSEWKAASAAAARTFQEG